MNILDQLQKEQIRMDIPDFRPGDTIKVHVRIVEGNRERIQVFEGVVIGISNKGTGSSFTVRKVSYGIGVERVFPHDSPLLDKVEIVSRGRVRRAKIYYIRKLRGKAARIKEKMARI
jgi:large subunit ribosomal protein L19